MRWHASPLPNESGSTSSGVLLFLILNNLVKMNSIIKTGDLVQTVYKGTQYKFIVAEVLYVGGVMMCRADHPKLPRLIKLRDCVRIDNE